MNAERPVFYFDLASPYAWLAAEQVNALFGAPPAWQPILLPGPSSANREEVERRAADLGLLAVRWPDAWPVDTTVAMRAATFAKQTGRAVAFALAAFRQAFAAGRDLSVVDNVLIAAAACELHPRAVLTGIETKAVQEELRRASEEARALGVHDVPAVALGGEVLAGLDDIEGAARRVR